MPKQRERRTGAMKKVLKKNPPSDGGKIIKHGGTKVPPCFSIELPYHDRSRDRIERRGNDRAEQSRFRR